jgi:hypothetical protein
MALSHRQLLQGDPEVPGVTPFQKWHKITSFIPWTLDTKTGEPSWKLLVLKWIQDSLFADG